MTIRRHGLTAAMRLGVMTCWVAVAITGLLASGLLAVGLDLRHHAVRTTAGPAS